MHLTKPLGLLAGLLVAGAALGSLYGLATGPLFEETAAVATLALVLAVVAVLALVGARSREWLAGPYW